MKAYISRAKYNARIEPFIHTGLIKALIQDNYKKMVVSMDAQSGNTFKGIEHWNLQQFLEQFE